MQRADVLLVERQQAKTRTHAQRLIKQGHVFLKTGTTTQPLTKAGLKVSPDCELIVTAQPDKYVSRGAIKLEGALADFGIEVTGKVAIDVGQSTGGFTDCLLQHGAKAVVGIEVGHDQLDVSLRNDPRVTCYERMNARSLPADLLEHTLPRGEGFDIAVMDVSFISQTKILPSLTPLLKSNGHLISLVKPQFEVGKAGIGKGGIVKDASLFLQVEHVIRTTCQELNLKVLGYMESPITGGDGNREFLLWAQKNND